MDRNRGERIGWNCSWTEEAGWTTRFCFPESDVTSFDKVQGGGTPFSLLISAIEGEMARRRRGIG